MSSQMNIAQWFYKCTDLCVVMYRARNGAISGANNENGDDDKFHLDGSRLPC